MPRRKKLTVKQIDADLEAVGSRSLVPAGDVPEYIDTSGFRSIRDKIHDTALINPGLTITLYLAGEVTNALLDKRNEVSPPVKTMADLDRKDDDDGSA